jgi:hypothetical protein
MKSEKAFKSLIDESSGKLQEFVEKENYKGWDPYDGLNSSFFQFLPFISKNRFARLAWIQLFKRNPLNLRPLLGVKKDFNSKGVALFLSSYCRQYNTNPDEAKKEKIRYFADLLISMQAKGWSGACWGYNFDWQARAFFQPNNTPTVVASVYCASALLDAYDILKDDELMSIAGSTANFILKDLNRTHDQDGDFCFSYSPLDRTVVYNATLLGSRLLSRLNSYQSHPEYLDAAEKSVLFCCKNQQENGAWAYGQQHHHFWIDNFHTGFNLECIHAFQKFTGIGKFQSHLEKGLDYYVETFFDEEGRSKYYNNQTFPVDIHAPAQLIVTVDALGLQKKYKDLCQRVLTWTIEHMQDPKGFFYYQKKQFLSSKIPYMRWGQAWMHLTFSIVKSWQNEN